MAECAGWRSYDRDANGADAQSGGNSSRVIDRNVRPNTVSTNVDI